MKISFAYQRMSIRPRGRADYAPKARGIRVSLISRDRQSMRLLSVTRFGWSTCVIRGRGGVVFK